MIKILFICHGNILKCSEKQLSDLYYLLDTGRAVCLLDGFDEVNRDYINDFQDELDVIKDGRPDTFFIMSSRDIPEIRTLNHYIEYDLQNLRLEQACELINRLDPDRVDDELKKDFINKLQKDAFRFNRDEKRDFVGNPLFLSLMIRTYDMIHDIPTQRYVFYEKTYIAMASEYDSKTKRMTRPFFTGLNEKTFQKYFAEFCALTYSDSKYEFDRDLMMEYFYQVVGDNGLNIDPELFIRDVTEKLCLIYKDGSVYEFIHRSFQEYFAAFYYLMMLSIDKDTVIETLKALDEKIRKDETLSMMYGMDDKTMEKYVILPFLEEMFAYNNDDADYKDYLRKYYPRLEYVTGDLDEDMCSNDDHTSAMYCFIKKQFGIDHEYISMSFECDEGYADDSEEYFWIDECWFGYTSHPGNMRLVQRFEIPTSYEEANNIYSSDDINEMKGFLCGIDVISVVSSCLCPSHWEIKVKSMPCWYKCMALVCLHKWGGHSGEHPGISPLQMRHISESGVLPYHRTWRYGFLCVPHKRAIPMTSMSRPDGTPSYNSADVLQYLSSRGLSWFSSLSHEASQSASCQL